MKHVNGMMVVALGFAGAAMAGCSGDFDSETVESGDIGETVEGATGSTPINPPDAEYLFEIPNPPSGELHGFRREQLLDLRRAI